MSIEARGSSVPPPPEAPPSVPAKPPAPPLRSVPSPQSAPPLQAPAEPRATPAPGAGAAVPPLREVWPPWPAEHAEGTGRPPAAPGKRFSRTAVVVTLLVLGLGLLGGAVTGNWLLDDDPGTPSAVSRFDTARGLWHSTPVDTLFPPVLDGAGAGPDGSDRTWTRLGVAPDSGCAGTLDPALATALRTVGCLRVVRATYRDATSSDVTTVGLVFTRADPAAMTALHSAFARRHLASDTALLPSAYPVPGTAAAAFGGRQRATWSVDVLTRAPVVVYAVTGFADGRSVTAPEPAASAMAAHDTSPAAQAGLGYEAHGVADRVERGVLALAGAQTAVPR
ncbi:hypothetical protein [Streptomyces sp. 8L]|uniref:hypothetical protein n=1 Tax=Streptomyces sp. 8L TaxID=2877242 RepID=UPI001CD1B7C9|nr:hypothetical protein [Streptomyces sp. 8L]MCA1223917.1 hypothetical protein [Streptomyces sp. 8L]